MPANAAVKPTKVPSSGANPGTEFSLTLVSNPSCPFVQRAAIALNEKGVPIKRIDVDLANKPDWFLAMSPTGEVPVLHAFQSRRLVLGNGPRPLVGEGYAAFFVRSSVSATTSPKDEGVGTMMTPASFRISTFSCADSPKAEMMAPAWPMRRPFGAESPAM